MLLRNIVTLLLLLACSSCFKQLSAQKLFSRQLPVSKKLTIDSLLLLNDGHSLIRNVNSNTVAVKYPTQKINKGVIQPVPKSIQQVYLSKIRPTSLERTNTAICYVISGRDYLKQDSLILYTGDPTYLADGNVLVSGQYADYSHTPEISGGFCIKSDIHGNVIWAKLFDSTSSINDFVNFFTSLELHDKSILLFGRTSNYISGNEDIIITKLDPNGNMIWSKTYASRYWQGFNGSGDYFLMRGLKEDPVTGDIYFVGNHWGGLSAITKLDKNDGHIIWSHGFNLNNDYTFGMVVNSNNLILFAVSGLVIHAVVVDKTNGDTIYTKHLMQESGNNIPTIYRGFSVVKQDNGHYIMSGPTTLYYEFPTYTGTKDLFHATVVELDENLNFVKAFAFKNRIESNGYNTRVSLFPDGSGVFTMFKYISPYTGESEVVLFKNGQIYHQRKRIHINEGIPSEPATLQLPDGGFLNIKLLGDSTVSAADGSKIDFYQIHTSDTSSSCFGFKDTATSLLSLKFYPTTSYLDSTHVHVISESHPKTYTQFDFATVQDPACKVISHCDSLRLQASANAICPGNDVLLTIQKNKECGSLVPLVYDTNWVSNVTRLTDTTYSFHFDKPGKGYIQASLMGCQLKQDSVFIAVTNARYSLSLGVDTVICPGNQVMLNAGTGFISYQWQDGSTDSIFKVTTPGTYFVAAQNSCGTIYHDTVIVNSHPPVFINAGADRIKCNKDTIHLTAPSGYLNYAWRNNQDTVVLKGAVQIVNPTVSTTYMMAAEKEPGCFAYDTLTVTVNTSPPIHLGNDTSICSKDVLMLDAGTGFQNYQWSNGSQQQQIQVNTAGTYFVKAVTAQGCASADTMQLVKIYSLPQPYIGRDSILCMGQTKELSSTGNYKTYDWSTGSTGNVITVNSIGTYWLRVTDANGCVGSDTTAITRIASLPANFLPGDTLICSYSSVQLFSNKVYSKYLWSTGSVQSSITVKQAGIYWLQVIDNNNCSGKDTVVLGLKDCMEGLYVPTAFSPNNDGKNDVFRPMLFGNIKKYLFTVYNRWGQIIFQSNSPGQGWDGKVAGQIQSSLVFIWSCNYQLEGQPEHLEKGTVTLIR